METKIIKEEKLKDDFSDFVFLVNNLLKKFGIMKKMKLEYSLITRISKINLVI